MEIFSIHSKFCQFLFYFTNNVYSRNGDLVGGFNPSEKYESQLGLFFPIYGKIENVPNHQPVIDEPKVSKSDFDWQQLFV